MASFLNLSEQETKTDADQQPKKKIRKFQNIVPVVVRQIRDHVGTDFKLFGMPCQILRFIGIIKSKRTESTKATYLFEDHTGFIPAYWWLENEDPNILPNIPVNTYVKLFGALRIENEEKSISVLHMEAVDDYNVITSHLLEVIYVRLETETKSREAASMYNPGTALAMSMSYLDENPVEKPTMLTPVQMKISNILCSLGTRDPLGVHIALIMNQFHENQYRDVYKGLQGLLNEGIAYSTIDEYHFKHTDIM